MPTSATSTIVRNPVIEDGFALAGTSTGRVRTGNQYREDPTANWMYGLKGEYKNDSGLTLTGDVSYSKGTLRQEIEVFTLDSPNNIVADYDFRGNTLPDVSFTTLGGQPWDPALYQNYAPQASGLTPIRAGYVPGNLSEFAARMDLRYDFENGFSVRGGVRRSNLSADYQSFRSRSGATSDDLLPFLDFGNADFLSSLSGNFPRQFVTAKPGRDYILERGMAFEPNDTNDSPGSLRRNQQRDFFLDERVLAG